MKGVFCLMENKIYELLDSDFNTVAYRFKTDIGTFDIPIEVLEKELEYLPESDGKMQSTDKQGIVSLSAKHNARTILYEHLGLEKKEQESSHITFGLIMGNSLLKLIERGNTANHRNCFDKVKAFLDNTDIAKQNILSLYGVRRTGKTFLMYQAVQYLRDKGVSLDKIAFITISPDKTEALELMQYITMLVEVYEIKYVFIDEITYVKDELSLLTELSYCYFKVKFVLTGTNSAGFLPLFRQYLYGRTLRVSTSYISYNEYIKLVGGCSVLEYIRQGGILQADTLYEDNHKLRLEQRAKLSEEYINTAIIQNLFGTIKQSDYFSERYSLLSDMYFNDTGSLETLLFKWLQKYSEPLSLQIMKKALESSDISIAVRNTISKSAGIDLSGFKEKLTRCLQDYLNIQDFAEVHKSKYCSLNFIDQFKDFLYNIDCIIKNTNMSKEFLIPIGLRYGLVCETLSSLSDKYNDIAQRYGVLLSWDDFARKLIEIAEGLLLEDVIYLELTMHEVSFYKYRVNDRVEIDFVVGDKLFEIKRKKEPFPADCRWLVSEVLHWNTGNAELYLLCNCEDNYSKEFTEREVWDSFIEGKRSNNKRVSEEDLAQRDAADTSNKQLVHFVKIDYFLSHLDEYI